MASKVRVAMANTRRAFDEYLSTTSSTFFLSSSVIGAVEPSCIACSVQCSRMKFGAPLHTLKKLVPAGKGMPPLHNSALPDTSETVNIIFLEEEKGISMVRL